MKCGLCGSGICADKKYKKLKNGTINSYIYYGCSKVRDKTCECGYIREDDLIEQFTKLIDGIDLNEISIREKLRTEVEGFKKFQRSVLGIRQQIQVSDVDIRDYAKYLLREGSDLERRELLGCLKGAILFKEKTVSLSGS